MSTITKEAVSSYASIIPWPNILSLQSFFVLNLIKKRHLIWNKSTGSWSGRWRQRLLWFKHLLEDFFRSRSGHEPGPESSDFFPLLRWRQLEIDQTSRPSQSRSLLATSQPRDKTPVVVPLISRDREGCLAGARRRSALARQDRLLLTIEAEIQVNKCICLLLIKYVFCLFFFFYFCQAQIQEVIAVSIHSI